MGRRNRRGNRKRSRKDDDGEADAPPEKRGRHGERNDNRGGSVLSILLEANLFTFSTHLKISYVRTNCTASFIRFLRSSTSLSSLARPFIRPLSSLLSLQKQPFFKDQEDFENVLRMMQSSLPSTFRIHATSAYGSIVQVPLILFFFSVISFLLLIGRRE